MPKVTVAYDAVAYKDEDGNTVAAEKGEVVEMSEAEAKRLETRSPGSIIRGQKSAAEIEASKEDPDGLSPEARAALVAAGAPTSPEDDDGGSRKERRRAKREAKKKDAEETPDGGSGGADPETPAGE